jgi:hypothetical protein
MSARKKTYSAHAVSGKTLSAGSAARLRSSLINFAIPHGANSNAAVTIKDSLVE